MCDSRGGGLGGTTYNVKGEEGRTLLVHMCMYVHVHENVCLQLTFDYSSPLHLPPLLPTSHPSFLPPFPPPPPPPPSSSLSHRVQCINENEESSCCSQSLHWSGCGKTEKELQQNQAIQNTRYCTIMYDCVCALLWLVLRVVGHGYYAAPKEYTQRGFMG